MRKDCRNAGRAVEVEVVLAGSVESTGQSPGEDAFLEATFHLHGSTLANCLRLAVCDLGDADLGDGDLGDGDLGDGDLGDGDLGDGDLGDADLGDADLIE